MLPGTDQPTVTMRLTSPAFGDGESIPRRFGYTEANVNPPLAVWGVPREAESLALVVDDPDAVEPAGKVWTHWLVWNLPPETETLPEGWLATEAVEGQNDYGERGYGGPNPPDGEHTYRFRLHALDASLNLPPEATDEELTDAMDGRVVEEAVLTGTYVP